MSIFRSVFGAIRLTVKRWLEWVRTFRRRRTQAPMESKTYTLGYHLVAFLDVQGQRDRFKELRLPKTPDEEAKVKEVLRGTAGFVVSLRELFRKQFEVFESGMVNLRAHTSGPLRPSFIGFSDSFVTSVPLRNDGGDLRCVVIVFSALSAASVVMLTSLASKHPLRGGIDVGLATEIGLGEIYGTALGGAYRLESEVAQYPRIVIGDELWRYLNSALIEFGNSTTPAAKPITAIVQRIMNLIAMDTDGKRILDYLGPIIVEHSLPGHAERMVKPAYEFVLAEEKRLISNGPPKLVERYGLLRNYFESRLQLWGLGNLKL